MTAVEGNTTFYSMPNAETIQRWADTMPSSFRFCPKLPRAYSHQGKLVPFVEASHRFLQTLDPLGQRLGTALHPIAPGLQLCPILGSARISGPVAPPALPHCRRSPPSWTGSRSPTPTA